MSVAQEIMNWRRDLKMVDGCKVVNIRTQARVNCWNWATSPTALRTDREHEVCRKLARRVRRELDHLTGWHESESGRLWVN
jgi:hypothetical protein